MPLLADIFSAGNTLKRKIKDLPGQIQLSDEQLTSLRDLAFGDPKNPLKITNPEAFKEYAEMGMSTPLSFANMGITKLGGKTIRELLYGDKPNLTSAEKSALTRFEKELKNPTVLRRERAKAEGTGDIIAPTPDVVTISEIGLHPEKLVGKRIVPVMGDLSDVGGAVTQIAGVPLERAVLRQGGRKYGLIGQNVGEKVAWASEPAAASSKTANLAKYPDEDVLGIFVGMGPQSINFSHHMAEGMVGQLKSLEVPQKAIKQLNKSVRETWVKDPNTKEIRYPFKDFAGVDAENIYDLMAKDGQLRKAIVENMSKAEFRNMGFPRWEDTAKVMTEPGLYQGEAGRMMFKGVPGGQIVTPSFQHGSYSAGIPGEYVGGLRGPSGEITAAPVEFLMPKTFEGMRAAGKKDPQIMRSLQMSHHGEKFTEEALDPLMRFLGYQ